MDEWTISVRAHRRDLLQLDVHVRVGLCRAGLVDTALETGSIFESEGFKYVKEALPNGTLHLIGLLSDGGVHSRFDQLQVCAITLDSLIIPNNSGRLHVTFETFFS